MLCLSKVVWWFRDQKNACLMTFQFHALSCHSLFCNDLCSTNVWKRVKTNIFKSTVFFQPNCFCPFKHHHPQKLKASSKRTWRPVPSWIGWWSPPRVRWNWSWPVRCFRRRRGGRCRCCHWCWSPTNNNPPDRWWLVSFRNASIDVGFRRKETRPAMWLQFHLQYRYIET